MNQFQVYDFQNRVRMLRGSVFVATSVYTMVIVTLKASEFISQFFSSLHFSVPFVLQFLHLNDLA